MGAALIQNVSLLAAVRPGDLMGPLAIVAVLAAVGLVLLMVRGSKFGWIFIAAAVLYAFYALAPMVKATRTTSRTRGTDGYMHR